MITDLWKGNTVTNKSVFYGANDFLILKASQGTTKDTKVDSFISDCVTYGKPFWLYIFLDKGDYVKQLDFFSKKFNTVLKTNKKLIGIIADIEDGQSDSEALGITKYIQSIANFYQVKWGIYTGYINYDKYESSRKIVLSNSNAFYWEARYTSKYKCHDDIDLWQNCGDITVSNVFGSVDTSIINNTRLTLKWYKTKRQNVDKEDLLATHLVNTAICQCGYKEKKSNYNIFINGNNVGDNNYTKYGQWIECNGDYWCASFVSYCFARAFGYSYGLKVLGAYSPACNGIKSCMEIKKTPKIGDVVFFSGTRHVGANHVGIVRKVDDNYIYTVEGNANTTGGVTDNGGMVCQKSYLRTNDRIIGYGRPKYTIITDEKYNGELPTKYPSKGYYYNGCDKSEEVEKIQSFLLWYFNKKGMDCEIKVNGVYKDLTEGYVKKFQEIMGLTANGKWGKLCYEKAVNISFKKVTVNV